MEQFQILHIAAGKDSCGFFFHYLMELALIFLYTCRFVRENDYFCRKLRL